MQIQGKIPLLIVAVLAWIVIVSSCANQGMPIGGLKDSIPPVLVETKPEYKALNFSDNEVIFTFDEYIIPDAVSEVLVVSPPLTKRPTIRTKSKSLIIQFNEELLDSTTYSLDFKNSIADNNEKNPYENLRFSFSTGDIFDSLRVAGRVMNALNLEPIETGLVMLHNNLHDSAVYSVRPNYIAKTDEAGLFMIDNIAPGTYHIFSLNDLNNDLMYNEGAEEIAFLDTLIIPSADYHEELDTLVKGVDSMMVVGHTHFSPDPVYLRQFTEDIFEQYLNSYERESRNKFNFLFNESVKDSFNIQLLDNDASDWYLMESNEQMDSLVFWMKDTTLARYDSLLMEVSYYQLDSMAQLYIQKDTVEMNFTEKIVPKSRKKKKSKEEEEEEGKPKPIEQFDWFTGLKGTTVELNKSIPITAPEPINSFDSTQIKLYLTEDTLQMPLSIDIDKDSLKYRTYNIGYKWEPEVNYTLEIDSAACENIYGITSSRLIKKFKAREEDYYGTIVLQLSSVNCPVILQLLANNAEEEVVKQIATDTDGAVTFEYLKPDKYKIKVIFDENGNGKWDIGSYQDKVQPERVAYLNEVQKVRSNWTEELRWDLKPDPTFYKKIRDVELEEKMRKEAEEKAQKERENPQREQMRNSMQGGNSSFMTR